MPVYIGFVKKEVLEQKIAEAEAAGEHFSVGGPWEARRKLGSELKLFSSYQEQQQDPDLLKYANDPDYKRIVLSGN